MYFIRFVWRALSSGALPYADISGNIRVKSQFENVTSRQFSMKISILQGVNNVRFVKNAFFEMIHLKNQPWKTCILFDLFGEPAALDCFLMLSCECVNLASCWGSGADRPRAAFFLSLRFSPRFFRFSPCLHYVSSYDPNFLTSSLLHKIAPRGGGKEKGNNHFSQRKHTI